MIKIIKKNRSIRRFYQNHKINIKVLKYLINLARLSPSAGNCQPLKYIIVNSIIKNNEVYSCLAWAGYLKNWDGPVEGEKPSAYIIILADKKINDDYKYDAGIASQSILLGASKKGLGGCIIGNIKRDKIRKQFDIEEQFDILLVIALGKPKEKVIIEDVVDNNNIEYWRDQSNIHHVPKRKLDDIIIKIVQE